MEQIRTKISNEEERNYFNGKLQLIGYFDDDRDYYGKMYSLKKTFAFTISSEFPKIVKSQLPLGIYDTSYSIELSAVEKFIVEIENILKQI